jgi:L,D-peptidoglycan transpeptidase YkuD (ErfK/YbiS/YcfS/YnhG family)
MVPMPVSREVRFGFQQAEVCGASLSYHETLDKSLWSDRLTDPELAQSLIADKFSWLNETYKKLPSHNPFPSFT